MAHAAPLPLTTSVKYVELQGIGFRIVHKVWSPCNNLFSTYSMIYVCVLLADNRVLMLFNLPILEMEKRQRTDKGLLPTPKPHSMYYAIIEYKA